jgi:Ca2+-binding RTX toxin-like protein
MPGTTPNSHGPTYYVPKIVIKSFGGNDRIWGDNTVMRPMEVHGGAGDDSIRGGALNDTLHGGAGASTPSTSGPIQAVARATVRGAIQLINIADIEGGRDSIDGALGNDTIYGSKNAACSIWGGDGNDSITGGSKNDEIDCGPGNDSALGNDGADNLYGYAGNDTLRGGEGNDEILAGIGNDRLDGNGGHDSLYGESGNDGLFGGSGNDRLDSGVGNDWVEGAAGHDTMTGSNGNDTMLADAGNDRLDGGFGNDWMEGGTGRDVINGGYGDDTLKGDMDNDTLLGGDGVGLDWLDGAQGNDSLDGGGGLDSMHGGDGIDTLLANRGNETLSGAESVRITVDGLDPQNDSWSCGPNSAARLLRSYGINASYEALRSQVQELSQTADYGMGTPCPELHQLMNQYKPGSQIQQGANFQTILNVLAQGRPMVALIGSGEVTVPVVVPVAGIPIVITATAPDTLHYICLTGFDSATQTIFFTDTDGLQKSYSYGDFQAKWEWPADGVIYDTLKSLGIKKRTIIW